MHMWVIYVLKENKMKTIAELIKQAEKNISFYMSIPTVGPLIGNPLGLMVLMHQRDMAEKEEE